MPLGALSTVGDTAAGPLASAGDATLDTEDANKAFQAAIGTRSQVSDMLARAAQNLVSQRAPTLSSSLADAFSGGTQNAPGIAGTLGLLNKGLQDYDAKKQTYAQSQFDRAAKYSEYYDKLDQQKALTEEKTAAAKAKVDETAANAVKTFSGVDVQNGAWTTRVYPDGTTVTTFPALGKTFKGNVSAAGTGVPSVDTAVAAQAQGSTPSASAAPAAAPKQAADPLGIRTPSKPAAQADATAASTAAFGGVSPSAYAAMPVNAVYQGADGTYYSKPFSGPPVKVSDPSPEDIANAAALKAGAVAKATGDVKATVPTPEVRKEFSTSQTNIGALNRTLTLLDKALSLNPNSFGGPLGGVQAQVARLTGKNTDELANTADMTSNIGLVVASLLKPTFGGRISNAEMQKLATTLQGLPTATREERARTLAAVRADVAQKLADEQHNIDALTKSYKGLN